MLVNCLEDVLRGAYELQIQWEQEMRSMICQAYMQVGSNALTSSVGLLLARPPAG